MTTWYIKYFGYLSSPIGAAYTTAPWYRIYRRLPKALDRFDFGTKSRWVLVEY